MIAYLDSLLPRLKQFSAQLDNEALLIDQPWVVIGEEGSQRQTYIFRRNKELLVTTGGEVTTGKWEYLAPMQSLLITQQDRKRLYNHGFFSPSVLILQKEGTPDHWVLVNPTKCDETDPALLAEHLEQQYLLGTPPALPPPPQPKWKLIADKLLIVASLVFFLIGLVEGVDFYSRYMQYHGEWEKTNLLIDCAVVIASTITFFGRKAFLNLFGR